MISIILAILKWIGIFILAVFGLTLVLLLILLLVPIRYRIQGARTPGDGILTAVGKVSWLASILAVTFVYDQEFCWKIRIFGIPLKNKKEDAVQDDSEELTEEEAVRIAELQAELEAEEDGHDRFGSERRDKVFTENVSIQNDPVLAATDVSGKSETDGQEASGKSKGSLKEKLSEIWHKIHDVIVGIPKKVEGIREKIASWKQQADTWTAFVKSDEVKLLISTSWKQIRRILKHLLPTSLRIRGNYGFADPAMTGKVTGFIYALPPRYQKGIRLRPHFQEECLDGDMALKGRIRLGSLLWPLLIIVVKPCTWKVYKKFKAITKKSGSTGDKIKNDQKRSA